MVNTILRLSFLIAILFSFTAFSQKENYQWYFGNQAALSFSTNPPTILNNSALMANKSCASIADTAGNLLFYTNGFDIWNKQHQLMANGAALIPGIVNANGTQSSIILKNPSNSTTYYLFATNAINNIYSLYYLCYNNPLIS